MYKPSLNMPQRLPDSLRDAVIEHWLLGYSRNSIALQFKISGGAVSSIVEEWAYFRAPDSAKLLRGLAVTLRKLEMSPAQCASGLRVLNLIDKMGLDVNSVETVLSEIYTRLQELDVNPKFIARYVEGLLLLADDMGLNEEKPTLLSVRKIDEIFEKRRRLNLELNEEFKLRKSKLDDINQQVNQSQEKLEKLLEQNRLIEREIQWTTELRDELRKYGLDVSNISRLVECARFFSENSCDVSEMVGTFSSYEKMQRSHINLEAEIRNLKNNFSQIQQQSIIEESLLQQRKLKNNELESLKEMGFGLRELKTLRNIICESAAENGQSTENCDAVKNFISDIENHHHDYLSLRRKVDDLKDQQSTIFALNAAASDLGMASMAFLSKNGITNDDVKIICKVMEIYTPGCFSNPNFELSNTTSEHNTRGDHQFRSEPQVREDLLHTQEDGDLKTMNYPRPPKMPTRSQLRTSNDADTMTHKEEGQVKATLVSPSSRPGVLIPQYGTQVTDREFKANMEKKENAEK